ncbi:hypothetical protein B0H10DRAFT_843073 [Mycena sp. CBHHK59/15]|nr:hypothetical protein B0H10DRAFT_843073 [Mycena sp. CBHHK59/15]
MNFLVTLRYLVFAIFIVCNAILASVAVWNSSLGSSFHRDSRVDTYLTVVGGLGLALAFSIIFIELARKNAFTSRVWFEIAWVSLFFMLDLGGASVLTVVGPNDMCEQHNSNGRGSNSSPQPGSCASTQVLLAFTWLCTFILFLYFVLLIILAVVNRDNVSVPHIWECTIHNCPPLTVPRRLASSPTTPALPRFTRNKMFEVHAPVPQRPTAVPPALYSLRSAGLDSQYRIEHFQPPEPPAPSALPPVGYRRASVRSVGNPSSALVSPLYPQYIAAAPSSPPVRPPLRVPSPPPLGDWPRADAPLRIKRKRVPGQGVLTGRSSSGPAPRAPVCAPRRRTLRVSRRCAHRHSTCPKSPRCGTGEGISRAAEQLGVYCSCFRSDSAACYSVEIPCISINFLLSIKYVLYLV